MSSSSNSKFQTKVFIITTRVIQLYATAYKKKVCPICLSYSSRVWTCKQTKQETRFSKRSQNWKTIELKRRKSKSAVTLLVYCTTGQPPISLFYQSNCWCGWPNPGATAGAQADWWVWGQGLPLCSNDATPQYQQALPVCAFEKMERGNNIGPVSGTSSCVVLPCTIVDPKR